MPDFKEHISADVLAKELLEKRLKPNAVDSVDPLSELGWLFTPGATSVLGEPLVESPPIEYSATVKVDAVQAFVRIAMATLLCSAVFSSARWVKGHAIESRFWSESGSLIPGYQDRFARVGATVSALAAELAGQETITSDSFAKVSRLGLETIPGAKSVAWLEPGPELDTAEYRFVSPEGLDPAARAVLNADATPIRFSALSRATRTVSIVATERGRLFSNSNLQGVAVYFPVFENSQGSPGYLERLQSVRGWLEITLALDELLSTQSLINGDAVLVTVFDEFSPSQRELIYSDAVRGDALSSKAREATAFNAIKEAAVTGVKEASSLVFAGRNWTVLKLAKPESIGFGLRVLDKLLLVVTLLFSWLVWRSHSLRRVEMPCSSATTSSGSSAR